MAKLYITNEARVSAIKSVNCQIDKLMSLPCDTLGGYGEATSICRSLNMLADAIFAEIKADDKNVVDSVRYARR